MKTIYERDGKFYRQLGPEERLRGDDMVVWGDKEPEQDLRWVSLLTVQGTINKSRPGVKVCDANDAFVFLRECDPLTAAMRQALQRKEEANETAR